MRTRQPCALKSTFQSIGYYDPKLPQKNRLKGVGESLFPKIEDYTDYYCDTSNNLTWIYSEYSEELVEFGTYYTSNYKTISYCRVFDEYTLANSSSTNGKRNLYIICFLNERLLFHFLSVASSKYTEYLGSIELEKLNFIERGRSLGFLAEPFSENFIKNRCLLAEG